MATYGYVRVSTVEQAEGGASLPAQRDIINSMAVTYSVAPITKIFSDDGVSGSKALADRRAGRELVAVLKPGDVVLCTKLDRMFRRLDDAAATMRAWTEAGIRWIFLDGDGASAQGRMICQIMAVFSEFEAQRRGERIKEAKTVLKASGKFNGGWVPFGYRVKVTKGAGGKPDRTLIPEPTEQAAIGRMADLREDGKSYREIADTIKREYGLRVSHMGVKQVLTRDATRVPESRAAA